MAPLLPSLVAHARDILSSAIDARNEPVAGTLDVPTPNHSIISRLGPLAARSILLARDGEGETVYKNNPHEGATNFRDINNTGVFVVFGLIGFSFVAGGIWFFFWAKNGGFYFKENDWDDYKSTVLRRKGPNGTILSGATPSTQLGGGSAYKDYDANTEYTGGLTQVSGGTDDTQSTLTGITGGVSDIMGRARRKAKRERKEREREKKKERRSREKAVHRGEDGVLVDEEAEAEAQSHLRAYRGEKAARVGGINKESEGSQWDGSTNPSHSAFSADSDLLSNRQETPTRSDKKKKRRREDRHRDQEKEASYRDDQTTYTDAETTTTATAETRDRARSKSKARDRDQDREASSAAAGSSKKAGGIRKVYSTAQRNTDREEERMRAEARRLAADKGRSAGRRDFSYQRAESYHRHNRSDGGGRAATIVEEEGDIGMLGGGRYLPAPGGESEVDGGGYENSNADHDNGNKNAQDDDLGTKTYRCYIPGLSSSAGGSSVVGTEVSSSSYQEEKRKKRAAGRNRRGDD